MRIYGVRQRAPSLSHTGDALSDRGVFNSLYRVRIGPIKEVEEFDRIVARLKSLGIGDAHLASAE